jgi:hypothetical protein
MHKARRINAALRGTLAGGLCPLLTNPRSTVGLLVLGRRLKVTLYITEVGGPS